MFFVRNSGINFAKALLKLADTTFHAFNLCMELFGIRRRSVAQDALAQFARVLEIDRLSFCTREQCEYLLEMLNNDWSEIEVTWTVRSSTGADDPD